MHELLDAWGLRSGEERAGDGKLSDSRDFLVRFHAF